jgi:hypothetical protein
VFGSSSKNGKEGKIKMKKEWKEMEMSIPQASYPFSFDHLKKNKKEIALKSIFIDQSE